MKQSEVIRFLHCLGEARNMIYGEGTEEPGFESTHVNIPHRGTVDEAALMVAPVPARLASAQPDGFGNEAVSVPVSVRCRSVPFHPYRTGGITECRHAISQLAVDNSEARSSLHLSVTSARVTGVEARKPTADSFG